MVLRGHFDGERVVLDDPVPEDVKPNTPVEVTFVPGGSNGALAEIARLARPGGLPPDFSTQHEHYVKSAPRR